MKKKILSLFLCVFCILIVCSGCSKKPSKTSELTGTYQIIDKEKREGYYTTTFVKSGNVFVPIRNYYPPRYKFTLKDIKTEEILENIYTSEEMYNRFEIGDKIKLPEGEKINGK